MASIGKKNPYKPEVDKRAIRAAKIQHLIAQQQEAKQKQRAAAGGASATTTKLPPAGKSGQFSGAPPASPPPAQSATATAASLSPVASARTEVSAAAAVVDQSNNPLTGHTYKHRAHEPDAAGNINHDRKRCKGQLHTIPATIVRGEGYPSGMLESTHHAEIQPHPSARPAKATLSTAKLWKLFPNGTQAPIGVGHQRIVPDQYRANERAQSSWSMLFGGAEDEKRPAPPPDPKYSMAGAQSTSAASYVTWNGARPSTGVKPITDHILRRNNPLIVDSTHRSDFHRYSESVVAQNRASYNPQTVHRYILMDHTRDRSNTAKNFQSESMRNFGPKGTNTRPLSLPPDHLKVPPPAAPFLFHSTHTDAFSQYSDEKLLRNRGISAKPPPPTHDERDETRNFETDYTHHFIQPTVMPDGAGLSKTKWK